MHRSCVPIRTAVVPRRLVGRPRCHRAPLRRQTTRASASDPSSSSKWNWNPFKEDRTKQEAAEKALREVMGDRKDVLARFDDSGDDGGDSGDSGDGGWEWSWDGFRDGFFQFFRLCGDWLSGVGRTFKAILYFAMGIVCAVLVVPTINAVGTLVRVLLRLDKAEDVYGPKETEPAGMQRSVLFSDDEEEVEVEPKKTTPLTERQRRSQKLREMQGHPKSDAAEKKS